MPQTIITGERVIATIETCDLCAGKVGCTLANYVNALIGLQKDVKGLNRQRRVATPHDILRLGGSSNDPIQIYCYGRSFTTTFVEEQMVSGSVDPYCGQATITNK